MNYPDGYTKALGPVRYAAAEPPQHVGYRVVSHTVNRGWRLEPPRRRDQQLFTNLAAAHELKSTLQSVFDARRHSTVTRPTFFVAHQYPDWTLNPIPSDGQEKTFHLLPVTYPHASGVQAPVGNNLAAFDPDAFVTSDRMPLLSGQARWQEPRHRDLALVRMAEMTDWGTPLARALQEQHYGRWGSDVNPFRKAALEGRDFVPFLALADWLDERDHPHAARVADSIRRAHADYERRFGE